MSFYPFHTLDFWYILYKIDCSFPTTSWILLYSHSKTVATAKKKTYKDVAGLREVDITKMLLESSDIRKSLHKAAIVAYITWEVGKGSAYKSRGGNHRDEIY